MAQTAADGSSLMAAREDVAVEDHVQVLVRGDPDHDLVRDRVVRVAPGVAMGDARREFLERDVRQPVQRVRGVVVVALLELGHPAALEHDRVDVAGDRQVVAQDDRVATLLGGPAPDPVDPGAVALAEHAVDEPVVARAGCPRSAGRSRRRSGRRRSGAAGPGVQGSLSKSRPRRYGMKSWGNHSWATFGVAVVQAARLGLEFDRAGRARRSRRSSCEA